MIRFELTESLEVPSLAPYAMRPLDIRDTTGRIVSIEDIDLLNIVFH